MKKINLLIILALSVVSVSAQSFQKGNLSLTDGTTTEGRLSIDNTSEEVLVKTSTNSSKISFEKIKTLTIGDRTYQVKNFGEATWMVHSLTSGKATLYHGGSDNYIVAKTDETSPGFSLSADNRRIPGMLSVLFSDCNTVRESLNKVDEFSQRNLVSLVSEYNQCSYGDYAPSESELDKANKFNTDKAVFYAGAGTTISNVSFFNNSSSESNIGFGINAGILVSPGFLGSLQGNLHFYLDGSATFYGSKDFTKNTSPTGYKSQTYRLVLGTEYHFNKNGKFSPFIGIGIGGTSDTFDGAINTNNFDITGGNTIYVPKAGVLFKLNNGKHLGLTASYIPEYENDLSFPIQGEVIPLKVNTRSLSIGVNYYF